MPRFILFREQGLAPAPPRSAAAGGAGAPADAPPAGGEAMDALRADPRVALLAETPGMLLVDCPEDVAAEWLKRMPGWTLQREAKVKMPDPRPKLKNRPTG